jgi:dTDP-4-amino-4,6-dideoxygalactose transaminase
MRVVPLVDLKRRHQRFADKFAVATSRVLSSGTVLFGPELDALEAELPCALRCDDDRRYEAVGVASGASALQLILAALGVGPGDEVVVPAFTAVPTASAVWATGAVPVPVDVDPATAAIDPEAVRAALTARTKAIVVVHLYGRPAPVLPLLDLGPPVVEDAAQAHGALTAVAGVAAVYSFYPTKNVGGIGDGGAVVTADPTIASTVRRLRAHGVTEQYVHVERSQNHRMSELEAAWLRLQLPDLATDNARRAAIARHYRRSAPDIRWQADHVDHVVHQCVLRSRSRDAERAALGACGVATGVHYPLAVTQQPAYRQYARTPCPESEAWASECISLPCFPELTDAEVERVATALETLGR